MKQVNERTLEELIDEESLRNVLDGLEAICHGKAEHLASNWQDANTAKLWEKAGKLMGKMVDHPAIRIISGFSN